MRGGEGLHADGDEARAAYKLQGRGGESYLPAGEEGRLACRGTPSPGSVKALRGNFVFSSSLMIILNKK